MEPVVKIQLRCDGDTRMRELRRFPVRIGREDDCELQLTQTFVSRYHARIERVGDGLVLVDEGSRNGIVCNGRRLAPNAPVPLVDGSEIRIKRLVATVRVYEATAILGVGESSDEAAALHDDRNVGAEIVDSAVIANERRAPRTTAVEAVARSLSSEKCQPRIHFRDAHLVALACLPNVPEATSPNIDALLDGLDESTPIVLAEPAIPMDRSAPLSPNVTALARVDAESVRRPGRRALARLWEPLRRIWRVACAAVRGLLFRAPCGRRCRVLYVPPTPPNSR